MNEIIFWSGIWNDGMSRPIGVYQLAFWLRKNNVECQVIDFCQWFSSEELIELTCRFISPKTKFIGVSSAFWPDENIPQNIKEAVDIIKKDYPGIKIIVGGQRADNQAIKKIADIIMLGESENQLLNLLKGHNLNPSFDITKLNHRFSHLDCIIDKEVLPIELGRGCIFKCKFCGHHNLGKQKHTYQRNINLIEEEISYNYENFKTTLYHFLDDTVNEDLDKIKNLSNIPKNTGVDINWNGYLRADLIWRYPETADLLIKSGMRSCFFGIESFHPYASRVIGKGWSGRHGKNFLPKLHNDYWNRKINIWCNFIIGLPNETQEDLDSTLEWCYDNPLGYHKFVTLNLYNYRSDTGSKSELSKNFQKYGYKIEGADWSSDEFDIRSAENLANKYNQKLNAVNKLTSWTLFDYTNCGVSIDEGLNISVVYKDMLKKRFAGFLKQYKTKLQSL